ncbi:MAG: phosphonate C-P lyase system protein PhnG [Candidatus Eremiobacteraeota bacterium]|nr:phosphonate C-P lyase system protein PhnG [Candidatus Eremiobacteraeota bacterium]MBV8223107.1 phosphonate C-P lyase system protein PhnG [Candidatus Eremiobacteraeota bacterium]MBV8281464.1 phosphonate C-P lyase system protein PhnG [Candidatus Eremiobacteraeota bacterium]
MSDKRAVSAAYGKERRSEGLAAAARVNRAGLLDLGERIALRERVSVTEAPAARSVMIELGTPVGAFCFTEVVVTTAAVNVGGAPGWAAVMGFDQEAALAAAIADATASVEVRDLAEDALSIEASARLHSASAMAQTKV